MRVTKSRQNKTPFRGTERGLIDLVNDLNREFSAGRSRCLDHDDFGWKHPKSQDMIDFKKVERDAGGKPLTLFLIPL